MRIYLFINVLFFVNVFCIGQNEFIGITSCDAYKKVITKIEETGETYSYDKFNKITELTISDIKKKYALPSNKKLNLLKECSDDEISLSAEADRGYSFYKSPIYIDENTVVLFGLYYKKNISIKRYNIEYLFVLKKDSKDQWDVIDKLIFSVY